MSISNKIYIYEDYKYKNFLPLTYFRPVFDLLCGIYTFRERLQKIYNSEIFPISRFHKVNSEISGTFISGRIIIYEKLPDVKNAVYTMGDEVVGFTLQKPIKLDIPLTADFLEKLKQELDRIEIKGIKFDYIWELMDKNGEIIISDFERIGFDKAKKYNIQGVYIFEEEGPVIIEEGAILKPPTIIEGPCFIRKKTVIDGAKIRSGCSFGENCRIGGEVEASIFIGYSNKHHEGFVGHSYIGEWVNLGALTTTSDLKNTYGKVKVILPERGEINTGLMKVGSFIGDHTKTGIGTLLTTGCTIGVCANIFGGGVFPKFIPSFSWYDGKEWRTFSVEKAIEIAKRVMPRRGITPDENYLNLIRKIYEETKEERFWEK